PSEAPHLHFEIRTDTNIRITVAYSTDREDWTDPSEFVTANRFIKTTFSIPFVYDSIGILVFDPVHVVWGPHHTDTVGGIATFTNVPYDSRNILSISGPYVLNQSFGQYAPCTTTAQSCQRGTCILSASAKENTSANGDLGFGVNERVEVYNTGGIG